MKTFPMMLTRRNFLRYGGTLAASVAVQSRAVDSLFGGTPIRVAVADYGRSSLPILHAAIRSPSFEVVAICTPRLKDELILHQMCLRYAKRIPVLASPSALIANSLIDAILLADDSDQTSQLAREAHRSYKKIFMGHPMRTVVQGDSASGRSPALVHVGLLSAHDLQVTDAAAYVQRGGIGEMFEAQIFTPAAEEWVWLEALNITQLIFEGLDSSMINLSPKPREITVSSKNGTHSVELLSTIGRAIHGAALTLRGTRGSLHIPLYSGRDRLEALSPMLEAFAKEVKTHNTSVDKSLDQARRAHLLLTTAQNKSLSVSRSANGR